MDTVFALASARGKAGVAVIRISGPDSHDAVRALAGSVPPARTASVRTLRTEDGSVLDEALVLVFDSGASFTGERVAELHVHGSLATIDAVLAALSIRPGLRPADPGEFTRRALENGRLDLAQIEGLADLIEAETEVQRRQAQRVFSGALGAMAESWRTRLVRAAALLEATIDFADEEVPTDVSPEVLGLLDGVSEELARQVAGVGAAERIREGFEVAIVGPPNVGKSTLLNYLAGRDAAITSEIAGTTRDVIEVRMELAGLPVTVLDTAGLRDTDDPVEAIGVDRARQRAEAADVRVFLVERPGEKLLLSARDHDLVVLGKGDTRYGGTPSVSGLTGAGVEDLVASIGKVLGDRASGAGLAIRARHRFAMERAISALESARGEIHAGPDRAELAAEDLRSAVRAMDSLVGRVDVEDVLDEIFASFCIGK